MADDKPAETTEVVAEETKVEESPVDESQQEISEPTEQPETEAEAEEAEETPAEPEPEETPATPSRREQLRVQDLLKKYGPPSEAPSQETKPNFRDRVNADDDTYKIMEDTAEQYAAGRSDQILAQAETRTWRKFLALEDKQVRAAHPELDGSNKERFHPALADAINTKYLRMIGWKPGDPSRGIPETVAYPDISYADFVEAEMEFADELASVKAATTTRNIAQQAATTGLRPDGTSSKPLDLNKAPEKMTDEELEAAMNAALPERDARGRFLRKT